jgi:RNA polymerase sigma-70 factor (ECF subfamily)
MFWKSRPPRSADDPALDGEAFLRFLPGLFGLEFTRFALAAPGLSGLIPTGAKLRNRHAMAALRAGGNRAGDQAGGQAGDQAKPEPGGDAPESANSAHETGHFAQPSSPDGVDEDMATLVLDKPALGAGTGSRPDPRASSVTVNYGADESSDAAIMLRVAAGDESGFNYLVEKHYRAMIHFLFRMVRNQAVAEELAQEVFLRVYRSRQTYRAEAKFTTWLYRIATNLGVNHARDTRHERAAPTIYLDQPDPETGTTPDVADARPVVEEELLKDERMQAIRKHVMALPERQRTAVLMHKYQGLDYKEIGAVLRLSESATKSLLFRAYQTLRERLKDFVQQD